MPIFYVYMENRTDRQDDEVRKVVAASSIKAKKMVRRSMDSQKFTISGAYRPKDFRIRYKDWYDLLSSAPAETSFVI
jgi:hypothetical protein